MPPSIVPPRTTLRDEALAGREIPHEEQHLHGGDWLREIVFGLNDGLVTTLVDWHGPARRLGVRDVHHQDGAALHPHPAWRRHDRQLVTS